MFFVGWSTGSPVFRLLGIGVPDVAHINTSRLFFLFGWMRAVLAGDRCPLLELVFNATHSVPESWVSVCENLCAFSLRGHCGAKAGSVCGCGSVLVLSRLFQVASDLSVSHVDHSSSTVNCGPDEMLYRFPRPTHSRFGGLARWDHHPFPEGRVARHLPLPSSCPFSEVPEGYMFHCFLECSAFANLREQWCRRCSENPDSVPFCAASMAVQPHFSALSSPVFIGQACERYVSLQVPDHVPQHHVLSLATSSPPWQKVPQHLVVGFNSHPQRPSRGSFQLSLATGSAVARCRFPQDRVRLE